MQQWDPVVNFKCEVEEKRNKVVYLSSSVVSKCEGMGLVCMAGPCVLWSSWGTSSTGKILFGYFICPGGTGWQFNTGRSGGQSVTSSQLSVAVPFPGLLPNPCQHVLARLLWTWEQRADTAPLTGVLPYLSDSSFSTLASAWLFMGQKDQ